MREKGTYLVEGGVSANDFAHELAMLCPDAIIGVDLKGIINFFNPAAERLTGYTAQEALDKLSITEIYGSMERAREINKALMGNGHGGPGRLEGYETEGRNREGRWAPVRLSAVAIVKGGEVIGSVGFFHDMTRRKQLEDELRRLSITDSLTGLYNRRHFHSTLSDEVSRAARYGRPLSLVCLDLDNFKPFNDNFGHQVGDSILSLVADCSIKMLRQQDTAFRIGGDEFCLLLVETDLESAMVVADRFRYSFNEQWPIAMSFLEKQMPPVFMSLGVAQLQPEEKPDSFLMRADLAMYEAKKAGGNHCVAARGSIDRAAAS